jgi:hypothetical protein
LRGNEFLEISGVSLAQALQLAKRLGPHGPHLAEVNKTALVAGASFTFLIMAIVIAVFGLAIPLFAQGRDGTQL